MFKADANILTCSNVSNPEKTRVHYELVLRVEFRMSGVQNVKRKVGKVQRLVLKINYNIRRLKFEQK